MERPGKRKQINSERRKLPSAHIPKRYYDKGYDAHMVKVLPGDYRVTSDPSDMLVTILGSCVSACIRDPKTGFGGMNHFMLPENHGKSSWQGASSSLRYGNHAMEVLINEIIRSGCPRDELEIKLFGGANVVENNSNIGHNNAEFVLEYLNKEGLTVAAQDLGGKYPRRIHYFPVDGKVKRLLLRRAHDDVHIVTEEEKYISTIKSRIKTIEEDDGIELFD